MNAPTTEAKPENEKLVCPSCGRKGAAWRVLPLSTVKLRSTSFLLLAFGALLLGGCGIGYLLAESKEGGSVRPVVTTVGEPVPAASHAIPPGVVTAAGDQPDSNVKVSPARRNAVLGMLLGGALLFAGSVMVFSRKKSLICPTCHAHSSHPGGEEDHVAKQAVRNSERREP